MQNEQIQRNAEAIAVAVVAVSESEERLRRDAIKKLRPILKRQLEEAGAEVEVK